MVNYSDPATIAQNFATLLKLWHVVNGIFIWEFVTTLKYEWDVLRGNRPYRWTIWLYSTARVCTLMAVVLNMVGFDTTTPINCQLWVTSEVAFAYLALVSASLLIVLRIIAIWNRDKIIVAIAMSICLTDIGFIVYGLVRLRSTWSPAANTCILVNFNSTQYATYATLFTDVVLLSIMLMGLLRMRLESGGSFGLGGVLWNQGLIWLLLVTVGEVPSTVLMILNLNIALTLIPQTPSMIIVTIAATRMYRSLTNICASTGSFEGSGRTVSALRARTGPIPLNPIDVTVRTDRDQYSTSPATSQSSYANKDQGSYKAHEVSFNGDVESGSKK